MNKNLTLIDNMRKIMIAVIAVLLTGSCSEDMPIGSTVKSTLYILAPGEAEFTVTDDNFIYSFPVCKGGYDGQSYKIRVIADEEDLVKFIAMKKEPYLMLPGNSYEFTPAEATISRDETKSIFKIVFNPDCITPGITFILPLRIVSEDYEAIVEDMSVQYLFVKRITNNQ
ncbi:MAG: DUF1735 domain-containing protein [Bacteroidales bacterium]|nr:DUF1735 domain-containing protein [Bacteroidales bacterium]